MFTKRIIPCLDVHGGRVVKGVNFVDLKDAGDPVEIAAAYDKNGTLVEVNIAKKQGSDAFKTLTIPDVPQGGGKVVLYQWESLDSMRPAPAKGEVWTKGDTANWFPQSAPVIVLKGE